MWNKKDFYQDETVHMSSSIGRVFKIKKGRISKEGRGPRFKSRGQLLYCNKVLSCQKKKKNSGRNPKAKFMLFRV